MVFYMIAKAPKQFMIYDTQAKSQLYCGPDGPTASFF